MEDEQEDLERGDEPPRARPLASWERTPAEYDADRARFRAEMAQLKALSWALDRIFDGKSL